MRDLRRLRQVLEQRRQLRNHLVMDMAVRGDQPAAVCKLAGVVDRIAKQITEPAARREAMKKGKNPAAKKPAAKPASTPAAPAAPKQQ